MKIVASRKPPPPPPAPSPNTTIGEYIVVDRIAVGGMAEVFRALEPRKAGEPRVVVLKRMLPHTAAEPASQTMFEEEARLGQRIHHPNVVQVLHYGDLKGQPFLTLEYVPGADLWRFNRALRRKNKELAPELAVYIIRELLAGLKAVHEVKDDAGKAMGIVHNDVSPSNVLVSVHGEVKLADLGIAKSSHERATKPGGTTKGKLGYTCPERITGEAVDQRADVFAAAVIAAEILMQKPLFAGGTELAVLLAIRDGDIQAFVDFAPQLPKGLAEVIIPALSTHPEERPASAQEFLEQLEPWAPEDENAAREKIGALIRQFLSEDQRTRHSSQPNALDSDAPIPVTPSLLEQKQQSTADIHPIAYRIRRAVDSSIQELTYASVVEGIATGEFRGDDQISVANGPFEAIASVSDLSRHLSATELTHTTTESAESLEAKLKVSFEEGEFIRQLLRTLLERKTGLWLCEQDGVRKEVYTQEGVPIFVTSNLAGELLGEYLVQQKVIGREELDMALAVMPRFEGKLGETLVGLGLIEPLELFQHIGDQVRDKLIDLFTWQDGDATFYENLNPPMDGFPLQRDPWQLYDRGFAERFTAGLENELLLERNEDMVAQVELLPEGLQAVELPEHVASVLLACTKAQRVVTLVEHLLAADDSDALRPYRAIATLLYMGAIEWQA